MALRRGPSGQVLTPHQVYVTPEQSEAYRKWSERQARQNEDGLSSCGES